MKPTERSILCATDFSDNARRAAEVARAIALRLRATLVLVHVTDQANAFGDSPRELRGLLRRARALLQAEVRRLRSPDSPVESVVLHGRWAEHALTDYIAAHPPLLVIVSAVSKTTFDRWTLGSVSEYLTQHAPVPTLVVRAPERLLAWARQMGRVNILVAADYTASSDSALMWVRDLQRVGECAVTVAYVPWALEERRWAPAHAAASLLLEPPGLRRRLLRDMRRKVGQFIEGAVDVRVEQSLGRADAALVQLASEIGADLIVLGTHQRHGAGRLGHASISRGVLRHARVNAACVPTSTAIAHGVRRQPHVQRVLVATDLSAPGDQAVPWAFALAPSGSTVRLVHVIEPWELPGPLVPHYDPKRSTRRAHRQRVAEARDRLAALVPLNATANGITTEVMVAEDREPARAIGRMAREFGADVICLSSGLRSRVAEAVFGSVLRRVIAQNPQPVMLVHPEEA